MNKLPPFGSWLYQQHSYMPTAGCPSSKAPVKDHWHWITCSTCEDGHKEQGRLFSAKLIGGQAPNLAWTETGCLLHFQIHPKLQQMWQLLRADNTCYFDNFPQSGQVYKTNTSIPKTLTSGTSPVPSAKWISRVTSIFGKYFIPNGPYTTNHSMDPPEWCCPHPPTLQLLLWAWIQWYSDIFNKPLEDRPLDNIKIWLSVRQLQQPSKIPESRSYLNEPLSKDYGEEPPSYTSSWLYRLYLFHLLTAPNLWSILLMMHAFLFHNKQEQIGQTSCYH